MPAWQIWAIRFWANHWSAKFWHHFPSKVIRWKHFSFSSMKIYIITKAEVNSSRFSEAWEQERWMDELPPGMRGKDVMGFQIFPLPIQLLLHTRISSPWTYVLWFFSYRSFVRSFMHSSGPSFPPVSTQLLESMYKLRIWRPSDLVGKVNLVFQTIYISSFKMMSG